MTTEDKIDLAFMVAVLLIFYSAFAAAVSISIVLV